MQSESTCWLCLDKNNNLGWLHHVLPCVLARANDVHPMAEETDLILLSEEALSVKHFVRICARESMG